MEMSIRAKVDISNLITKLVEVTVIAFYSLDVLPKILVWKKPVWWKCLNAILISSIVIMIPISIMGFQSMDLPYSQIKLKVMSLSLSLLLFIEIVTGRDASDENVPKYLKLTELEKLRRKAAQVGGYSYNLN